MAYVLLVAVTIWSIASINLRLDNIEEDVCDSVLIDIGGMILIVEEVVGDSEDAEELYTLYNNLVRECDE